MVKRVGWLGLNQLMAADAVMISALSAQRIERDELEPEGQQQQLSRYLRTRN